MKDLTETQHREITITQLKVVGKGMGMIGMPVEINISAVVPG